MARFFAMMRQHVRGDSFIPSWSNTACMRHSPMSGFSCFLRISLATSSVTFLGARLRVRLVIQSLDPFLPPAFQRRVHRLFTHPQILGDGGDRPSFHMKLHNVVTTLRRIRGVIKERERRIW